MKNLLLLIVLVLPFYQASAAEFKDLLGVYLLVDGDSKCNAHVDLNIYTERVDHDGRIYEQDKLNITTWNEDYAVEFSYYTNMDNLNGGYFLDGDVITKAKSKIVLQGNQLEIKTKGKVYFTNSYRVLRKVLNYTIKMKFNVDGEMSFTVKGRGTKNRKCLYRK